MKILHLFVLSFFILSPNSIWAQVENTPACFFDKLNTQRYHEMGQLYMKFDSVTPTMALCHTVFSAISKNQNRLAIEALEKNLLPNWNQYPGDMLFLFQKLIQLYIEEGKYTEAHTYSNWFKEQYYPTIKKQGISEEYSQQIFQFINNMDKFLDEAVLIPPMRVVRKKGNQSVNFTIDPLIMSQIEINGSKKDVFWDTGVPVPMYLTHQVADTLRIAYGMDSLDTSMGRHPIVNIDSIVIGNYSFYNVPTLIIDMANPIPYLSEHKMSAKKLRKAQRVYDKFNRPMIGLPIIKRLGRLEVDWKHKLLSFPHDTLPKSDWEEQIQLTDYKYPRLTTPIMINNMNVMGIIDSGFDSYMLMRKDFYQRYSNQFPVVKNKQDRRLTLTVSGAEDTLNIHLHHPTLVYGGRVIQPKEKINFIGDGYTEKSWDMLMGLHFFKSLGQNIIFDFKDMKLKVWKKSINFLRQ